MARSASGVAGHWKRAPRINLIVLVELQPREVSTKRERQVPSSPSLLRLSLNSLRTIRKGKPTFLGDFERKIRVRQDESRSNPYGTVIAPTWECCRWMFQEGSSKQD